MRMPVMTMTKDDAIMTAVVMLLIAYMLPQGWEMLLFTFLFLM